MPSVLAKPSTFFFDLDGVLVRTEELHHRAYELACAQLGRSLGWSFERYCVAAHYGTERLVRELRAALPGLLQDIGWSTLYEMKTHLYSELLRSDEVQPQPGAEAILQRLASARTARAVVTNSSREQAALLRSRVPILNTIPEWVTREDYDKAKPAPDAYRVALARVGAPPFAVVGFEDTPRGLQALAAAGIPAVLVTTIDYPEFGGVEPVVQVHTLAEVPHQFLGLP